MALFGVGLDFTVKKINQDIKLFIKNKNLSLAKLYVIFNEMDINKNKKLEHEEFEQGLRAFGFFMKKNDLQALHKMYDIDGDGFISFEEFLKSIRDPLNERRKNYLKRIYNFLDRGFTNQVSVKDLELFYDVSKNPLYTSGKLSRDELFKNFVADLPINREVGTLSWEQFEQYYQDVGAGIASDKIFIDTLYDTWGVPEEEGSSVDLESVKDLVKTLRQKIIQSTKGIQDEFILLKLFTNFDKSKSGNISVEELHALVAYFGIYVEKKQINLLFKHLDVNNKGVIEYKMVMKYIINDPYR